MKGLLKLLMTGLGILVIICVIFLMQTKSSSRLERNLLPIKCLEEIPAVAKLLKQNPELSKLLKKVKYIGYEDIDLLKQNPDFVEYLGENPEIAKMIINDPNSHERLVEVYEKLLSRNSQGDE